LISTVLIDIGIIAETMGATSASWRSSALRL
jgi:hypothetical protein